MIELHRVGLQVGGHRLLSEIEASVGAGELVAVIGPNGAGKTTLLRAIAGLHPIAAGSITIEAVGNARLASLERARRVALVIADDVMLDALSVYDVVSIGRFPHHRWWQWRSRDSDDAAVAGALAAVGMNDMADRLFSTLSSGERQRIWIALGLAQETPILLLDEPTSHLDVRVAHEILDLLRGLARAGKSIVCALHDLNEASGYADRIALLGNGRLIAVGRPEVVLNDPRLEQIYGIAMERIHLPGGGLRVFATDASLGASARPNRAPNA